MSAQPYFRSRPQRRDRDVELERLVAAELDACEAPLDTLIESPVPAHAAWPGELSAAERDFVDLVRQWLDRRPNKHQLLQLICDADAPAPQPPAQVATSSAVEESQPASPSEPDSHAAP
jgi:hypothetical protein